MFTEKQPGEKKLDMLGGIMRLSHDVDNLREYCSNQFPFRILPKFASTEQNMNEIVHFQNRNSLPKKLTQKQIH